MFAVSNFFLGICLLAVKLLPVETQSISSIVVFLVLGPVICHRCFLMFYSDYELKVKSPESEPSTCAACSSAIEPGTDTCPQCGWTYKTS